MQHKQQQQQKKLYYTVYQSQEGRNLRTNVLSRMDRVLAVALGISERKKEKEQQASRGDVFILFFFSPLLLQKLSFSFRPLSAQQKPRSFFTACTTATERVVRFPLSLFHALFLLPPPLTLPPAALHEGEAERQALLKNYSHVRNCYYYRSSSQ